MRQEKRYLDRLQFPAGKKSALGEGALLLRESRFALPDITMKTVRLYVV